MTDVNNAQLPAETVVVEEPNQAAIELFDLSYSAMSHFAQMLVDEGELRGLIGPRELPRLWSRHLVNSAAIVEFIPQRAQMLDVGSGAGFPGMVAAIMRPDVDVHLVEPMLRRVEWLEDVVAELGLDNVTVHHKRAEELHGQGKADVVTSRAVANLKKLMPICMPLVRSGGSLVALKGRKAADEVAEAQRLFKKFHVAKAVVHEVSSVMEDESTMVVEIKTFRR
ncbi:16S rRNA methyltransferase GidB [Gleimia coleocanis DSM 15436]|uniref:Ribosomal RNA small subunit methyltransferase G n=1 Tax=Gleimia coleocanis DSM 15436 TaxID=525245 RepID=C0VXZ7_9ACTO|nr:16S rRNA methyltransferase GidB [Gleimia coleocanis DSM 15436]